MMACLNAEAKANAAMIGKSMLREFTIATGYGSL